MKFHPETLGYRVILKPHIVKETPSGIVIATSDRNQAINADKGIIIMYGPEAWEGKPAFGINDQVYYAKYGAKVLKDENTDELYIICNDEDILVRYTNHD